MGQVVIDLELVLDQVQGNLVLLREIAGIVLDDFPRQLGQLEEAAQRRDAEGVRQRAHQMKGAVANFGARETVQAAQALERAGQRGEVAEFDGHVALVKLAWSKLEPELRRVVAEIDSDTFLPAR
ncbi:MAG TPA: Hpt domain-containing protein [Polyangiaceae bacterium]|nr:Hpt domain-containing protein [Polyangiaceae bacterium]